MSLGLRRGAAFKLLFPTSITPLGILFLKEPELWGDCVPGRSQRTPIPLRRVAGTPQPQLKDIYTLLELRTQELPSASFVRSQMLMGKEEHQRLQKLLNPRTWEKTPLY